MFWQSPHWPCHVMWKEEGKSFCLYWTELFVDCMSTTVIPEHTLLMWGDSLAPWKRGFLDSGFKFQTGPGSVYPGQSRGCMDIQHRYLVPSQGFFFWYSYSKVARIQDSNYAFQGPILNPSVIGPKFTRSKFVLWEVLIWYIDMKFVWCYIKSMSLSLVTKLCNSYNF